MASQGPRTTLYTLALSLSLLKCCRAKVHCPDYSFRYIRQSSRVEVWQKFFIFCCWKSGLKQGQTQCDSPSPQLFKRGQIALFRIVGLTQGASLNPTLLLNRGLLNYLAGGAFHMKGKCQVIDFFYFWLSCSDWVLNNGAKFSIVYLKKKFNSCFWTWRTSYFQQQKNFNHE